MVKPMDNKSEEMKAAIEAVFPGTQEKIAKYKCPCCGEAIGPFRNAISQKEYQISGMCQKCQDATFGAD